MALRLSSTSSSSTNTSIETYMQKITDDTSVSLAQKNDCVSVNRIGGKQSKANRTEPNRTKPKRMKTERMNCSKTRSDWLAVTMTMAGMFLLGDSLFLPRNPRRRKTKQRHPGASTGTTRDNKSPNVDEGHGLVASRCNNDVESSSYNAFCFAVLRLLLVFRRHERMLP
mmetsp:Transcript_4146/g.11872  ORF Transcript_4146/g.11872 Transcript_4146/m.11872 type:complete len:169 (-) Transcript_4146:57-563(-)